jgi:effector-binding domain-containing protein
MIENPEVTTLDEQDCAVVHLTISRSEIQTAMEPARAELFGALEAQGLEPAGPWFTWHLRRPTETLDFHVGVPVSRPVSPSGRVTASRLPSGRVVRAVHRGDYAGLRDAWGQLQAWMETHDLTPGEEFWEVYLEGPETGGDASKWRTELNRPLSTLPSRPSSDS